MKNKKQNPITKTHSSQKQKDRLKALNNFYDAISKAYFNEKPKINKNK